MVSFSLSLKWEAELGWEYTLELVAHAFFLNYHYTFLEGGSKCGKTPWVIFDRRVPRS